MSQKLVDAMINMREKEALEIARALLDGNEEPIGILDDGTRAMEEIGKRFEKGNCFLPELIMAGEMMRQIAEMVKPKLKGHVSPQKQGKVIIGTVQGDIHDIGKNIVTFMLEVSGFDVRDIGIDIPPAKFVEEIKNFQPQIVGLSGLLTSVYDSMKNTVETITSAGLRDNLKIMIGGGQMSDTVREYTGADAFGADAVAGVRLAKKWIATK
jgi:methanogenic corrinoid protein MtbC1